MRASRQRDQPRHDRCGVEGVRRAGQLRRVLRVHVRRLQRTGRASTACRRAGCSSSSPSSRSSRRTATATTKRPSRCCRRPTASCRGTTRTTPSCRRPTACPTAAGSSSTRNNTPRIARIDLTRFETDEIIQIPNCRRRPRVAVHHAEHQVRRLGDALQRADPEHRRADRQLQAELQGHAVVHHGRPAGQDGHRVPDPDARATTTTSATPARVRPTAGSSSRRTTASRRTPSSRRTRRRTTRTSSPR